MKKLIILHILFILYNVGYAQTKYGFADGFIINKQGDTTKCQVELAVTYGNTIKYKPNNTNEELSISIKKVKSVKTPYAYYENIKLGKAERLMSLMVDGQVQLFKYVILNTGPGKQVSGGTMSLYEPPTILYAIVKNRETFEVKKRNHNSILLQVTKDCPSVNEKVTKSEYQFEALEKLITEYNACL